MSRERFTLFAWSTLGFTLLVILWGAVVRATGAGAGCGSHWPLCNGEVVPQAPATETLIEFTHRLTSGVALLLAVALLIFACKLFPRGEYPNGHRVRTAAWWTMIFMLGEAAVGAMLVLLELVADNQSIARAWVMALHLINTFLLLGAMTLTAWWAGGGPAMAWNHPDAKRRALRPWMIATIVGTLLIGATGAIAALGDTLFPPTDLATEMREKFDGSAHILKQLRIFHPLVAVLVSLLTLHMIGRIRETRAPKLARRWATRLNLLVLGQLALGTINVLLLAPVYMQLIHLLVADALWIALVLTCAAALAVDDTGVDKAVVPDGA